MKEKKDCAFQFYIGGTCVEDTGLITRVEADELWQKHRQAFIEACRKGYDIAEMALWIDMRNEINYQKTAKRVYSEDVFFEDGKAFLKQRIP